MRIPVYSFIDIHCSLVGPGVNLSLGYGAGNAEEGISIEYLEEQNTMMMGADGSGAHSLHASRAGRITIRLLKNSPRNSAMSQAWATQISNSLLHGQNVIALSNINTGDQYTCDQCAFSRKPPNNYAKDANILEWEFVSPRITFQLGGSLISSILGSIPAIP